MCDLINVCRYYRICILKTAKPISQYQKEILVVVVVATECGRGCAAKNMHKHRSTVPMCDVHHKNKHRDATAVGQTGELWLNYFE